MVVRRVSDQDRAFARRHVNSHQVDADIAAGFGDRPASDDKGAIRCHRVRLLVQRATGRRRQVPRLVLSCIVGRRRGHVEANRVRAQVMVPVPHRVALVQHGRDVGVLPRRAPLLVVLGVRRRRQDGSGQDHRPRIVRHLDGSRPRRVEKRLVAPPHRQQEAATGPRPPRRAPSTSASGRLDMKSRSPFGRYLGCVSPGADRVNRRVGSTPWGSISHSADDELLAFRVAGGDRRCQSAAVG